MFDLDRVHCADCLEALKSLPDNCADIVIADPPYFKIVNEKWDHQWKDIDEYLKWSELWIKEALRILKNSGSLYIFGGIGEKGDALLHLKLLTDRLGGVFKDMIVWAKQRGYGNRRGWLYTREELLWYVKINSEFIWNKEAQFSTATYDPTWVKRLHREANPYKRSTNVWTDIQEETLSGVCGKPGNKKKKTHLTQKPYQLIERIIKAHLVLDGLVVDPFAGSGVVGRVAMRNRMHYIGFETDQAMCDEANYAGQDPIL